MKIHVTGSSAPVSFGHDFPADLLRSQLRSVWSNAKITVSGIDDTAFSPTEQHASVLTGNFLLCGRTHGSAPHSVSSWLRYPAAMQWFNKKSYLLGAGFESQFDSRTSEFDLAALDAMQIRTVRDSESAASLREAGVSAPVLECADLSYLTPAAALPFTRYGDSGSKPVLGVIKPRSGWSMAGSSSNGFEDRIAGAIASLDRHFAIRFLRIDDLIGHAQTETATPASNSTAHPNIRSADAGNVFSKIDMLLTLNTRSTVLAAAMGIPFVALGTDGEGSQRECRALDYPFILPLDANANDIVQSIHEVSSERPELERRLRAAANGRVALARRTFDALRTQEFNPDTAAHEVFSGLKTSVVNPRILLVWNAPLQFLHESGSVLSMLGALDAITAPHHKIDHPNINELFVLERPGVMHWKAFSEDLRRRIQGAYDGVVVCHSGRVEGTARHLISIATHAVGECAGFGSWEYRLWTHTARALHPEATGENASLTHAAVA